VLENAAERADKLVVVHPIDRGEREGGRRSPTRLTHGQSLGLIAALVTPSLSSARATRNASLSHHGAATIWTPIGSSPAVRSGTATIGRPIKSRHPEEARSAVSKDAC